MTEREYIAIVPSPTMRSYLDSNGWKFSPYQRACLVWNSRLPFCEKLEYLRQIRDHTGSTSLKEEIDKCLIAVDSAIKDFQHDDKDQYVYTLHVKDNEYSEFGVLGYFRNYQEAYVSGQKFGEEFLIIRHMFSQIDKQMQFNAQGECVDFINIFDANDTFYMNPKNFTGMYICIPHPFIRGDIVYDIGGDLYGVVTFTTSDRKSCDIYESRSNVSCFTDSMIEISYPDDKTGLFKNKKVNPLYLTYFKMENRPDKSNLIASILYSAHELYKGKDSLVNFSELQARFFQECQRNNYR